MFLSITANDWRIWYQFNVDFVNSKNLEREGNVEGSELYFILFLVL